MAPRKTKEQVPSLDEFAEGQAKLKFAEHEELLRGAKVLRSNLAERTQELLIANTRLAEYEHPGRAAIERLLAKKPSLSREQIAKELDYTYEQADEVLADMAARGYNVVNGILSRQASPFRTSVEHFYGDEVRFGIISDTHWGNHHAMEEQVHEAYEVFRREGITRVYVPGNMIDGEKTYRGQEYEISVMGVDNVVRYVASRWPKVPGITTYHIASSTCHEGYYLKSAGVLVGKLIQFERPDMVYLGLDEADVVLHDSEARPTLRIVHPGGGTSYADSYRPQKIVESYPGSEKPTMLAVGHYHKGGFYDIRDVMVLQAACLERQTPFMRKLALRAVLGFWTVEARFSEHGSLRRFRPEYWKYYLSGAKVLRDWKV